jgi:hypothetical protein
LPWVPPRNGLPTACSKEENHAPPPAGPAIPRQAHPGPAQGRGRDHPGACRAAEAGRAEPADHPLHSGRVAGDQDEGRRHVTDLATQALERSRGVGAIPAAERLYQFKITLLDIQPAIWRRIQEKDCTLDRLHEHIQTAMGWTNSHLHDFKIGGKDYGDPLLLDENFEEFDYGDSTATKLSDILPRTGKRFRFEYKYDFGDGWRHEVLFEGCLRAEQGQRYPLCTEGARACPPEDVGGTWGYADFVEAIQNEDHEQHEDMLRWVGGRFDPAAFDPARATRRMWRGLPDWRRMV